MYLVDDENFDVDAGFSKDEDTWGDEDKNIQEKLKVRTY